MQIYKELFFEGNKQVLDIFSSEIYNYFPKEWIRPQEEPFLDDYVRVDYIGNKVPKAEVLIYYGADSWREGTIRVNNIVPLEKSQLSIDEYNQILDLFYVDVVVPYCEQHSDIIVTGPSSGRFDPSDYITEEALKKLRLFCNAANKSTGSTHPCDEERWFDFICQTVEDNRMFDYDTLYRFLMDKEYWGEKPKDFIGVMGTYAWSEDMAAELAMEYENYTRFLEYYKKTRMDK